MPDLPPCPSARDDCRIQKLNSQMTCLGWTPIYDRQGKLVNHNPNIRTTSYLCTVCGASFVGRRSSGETTWETSGGRHG